MKSYVGNGLRTMAFASAFACITCTVASAGGVREANTPLQEFSERAERYIELQKKLEAKLPKLSDKAEPQKIVEHRSALAKALSAARANARRGDIFTPAAEAEFKKILAAEMGGSKGRPARQTSREGNPAVEGNPAKVKLAVNAVYPEGEPVSSMPPSVLLKLPQLPKESLEYRFVGKHLILRDTKANLIVDFIEQAAP